MPTIRALYKSQRDAMLTALDSHLSGSGVTWNTPDGGMFLWLKLPHGMNAAHLLPKAVERNVAFVPGSAFYADTPQHDTLRLSFVTASVDQINVGIAALADVFKTHLREPSTF